MARPYGRIVVLHITIIFGGMAAMALGTPIWALVLLLVLKTGMDLKAHLKEREKMAGRKDGSARRDAGMPRNTLRKSGNRLCVTNEE